MPKPEGRWIAAGEQISLVAADALAEKIVDEAHRARAPIGDLNLAQLR